MIVGAIVACSLKLTSPHRNPVSWFVAALVGALGGLSGMFAGRMVGISGLRSNGLLLCAAITAAGLTLLYALVSRAIHRTDERAGRKTRHTLIF